MSPRHTDARQRVVAAAAEMLACHGLNATSIRETAKLAEAPLGSIYHHFPEGKQQVVREAVQLAARSVDAVLAGHLAAGIDAGMRSFLAAWREDLVRTGFRRGCPVMAAAAEEPIGEVAEDALASAAEAFSLWESRLVDALRADGRPAEAAAELATLIVASVEGAIVLCRAQRSIAPFDRVTAQLMALIASRE